MARHTRAMRYPTLIACVLVTSVLGAAEETSLPAPEADWESLTAVVWPESSVHETDFGAVQSGLRIAARPALRTMPVAERVPIAVCIENTTDQPIAMYDYRWSLTLKSAADPDRGTTRMIGASADASWITVLPAGKRIMSVHMGRARNAADQGQFVLHLNMPTLDGLDVLTPHSVYQHHGDLVSAPFVMTWQDGEFDEYEDVLDLMRRAAFREPDAVQALAGRHDLVHGALRLLMTDAKLAKRLGGQMRWHPEWQADDALITLMLANGPWGKNYLKLNQFAWNLAEIGHCGGSDQRAPCRWPLGIWPRASAPARQMRTRFLIPMPRYSPLPGPSPRRSGATPRPCGLPRMIWPSRSTSAVVWSTSRPWR